MVSVSGEVLPAESVAEELTEQVTGFRWRWGAGEADGSGESVDGREIDGVSS